MTDQQDISNIEIVAETFRVIRARELREVEQVKAVMLEQFPDISDERRQECLVELATILCKANPEVLASRPRASAITPDRRLQLLLKFTQAWMT